MTKIVLRATGATRIQGVVPFMYFHAEASADELTNAGEFPWRLRGSDGKQLVLRPGEKVRIESGVVYRLVCSDCLRDDGGHEEGCKHVAERTPASQIHPAGGGRRATGGSDRFE